LSMAQQRDRTPLVTFSGGFSFQQCSTHQ
jgi:hypothetical protein